MKSFKTYLKEQDSRTQQSTSGVYSPVSSLDPKGDAVRVADLDKMANPTWTTREYSTRPTWNITYTPANAGGTFGGARDVEGHSFRTDPAPTPLDLMNQFYDRPPSDTNDTSNPFNNVGYVQQIVKTRMGNPNYAATWPQNFQDFRLDQPFELPVEADDKKLRILTSRPPEIKLKLDNDPDSMHPPQGEDTGVLTIDPNGRLHTLGGLEARNLGLGRAAENISDKSTNIDPKIVKAITDAILSQPRGEPHLQGPFISSKNKDNQTNIPQRGADYAITTKMFDTADLDKTEASAFAGDARMYRMGSTNYPWNYDFAIANRDGQRALSTGDIPGVSIPHSMRGSSPLQRSVSELARLATQRVSQLKQQYKQGGGPTISPTSPNSDVNRFVDFVIPNLGSSEELSRYLELLVPRQTPEEFAQSLKDAQERVSFGRTQAGNTETPKPSDEDVQKEMSSQEQKRKDKAYREALEKAARVIAKGTSSQPLDLDTRMA